MTSGDRRWLRGPARCGPTSPLFCTPIAIVCASPKPLVGEWQPPHVLSRPSEWRVSNQRRRPSSTSLGSSGRPRFASMRAWKVCPIVPVKPAAVRAAASWLSIEPVGGPDAESAGISTDAYNMRAATRSLAVVRMAISRRAELMCRASFFVPFERSLGPAGPDQGAQTPEGEISFGLPNVVVSGKPLRRYAGGQACHGDDILYANQLQTLAG